MRVESRCDWHFAVLRMALLGLVLMGATACSPIGMGIGAAATVADMAMQERGLVAAAGDDVIWTEINRRLLDHSLALAQSVHVQSHEGRVLLTGRVDRPELRLAALRAAWGAPWVRSVRSEIVLAGGRSTGQFALDGWLIGRLRTKLFFDREIRANNYSIECIDGVIYLIGVAQDREELQRVVDHARDIPYVRDVLTEMRLSNEKLAPIPAAPPALENAAIGEDAGSGAALP